MSELTNPNIPPDCEALIQANGYEFIRELGHGAFSTVFLVQSQKYNQLFALKRTKFPENNNVVFNDVELQSLIGLNHPNIIRIYDYFRSKEAYYSTLEYCSKGTLKEFCQNGMKLSDFFSFAIQITTALERCHGRSIAHRDIKPDNIFIDEYDRPKLADFGLSFCSTGKDPLEIAGSVPYMAPEVVSKKISDPFKADIWSLGITFYYMACGQTPWHHVTNNMMKQLITKGEIFYPQEICIELQRFLNSILRFEPMLRPTCAEIAEEIKRLRGSSRIFIPLSNSTRKMRSMNRFPISSLEKSATSFLSSDDEEKSSSLQGFHILKSSNHLNKVVGSRRRTMTASLYNSFDKTYSEKRRNTFSITPSFVDNDVCVLK